MLFATSAKETPAKIHVQGLVSLSSSNKKKNLSKCLKNNKNTAIAIDLDYGLVKRDSFVKFVVNVFQYLLYDNEVIPIPFQYFERIYATKADPGSTPNVNRLKRQNTLSEMFSNLNVVFDFVMRLFEESTFDPTFIAMCFGDSVRFAKEVFLFNVSNLNLCTKLAGKANTAKMPLLTLNYLITTFYKRLLNEASEDTSRKGTTAPKSKATSVIFTVKINSRDIDEYEKFTNEHSPPNSIVSNRFQYFYRLGCTITKTTTFTLDHLSHHPSGVDANFDIYHDGFDVEEIIEEKLIEEDEENLTKSTLADLDAQSLNDSANSNNGEEVKDDSADSLLAEKKSAADYIWVQIGVPVRCFSKI